MKKTGISKRSIPACWIVVLFALASWSTPLTAHPIEDKWFRTLDAAERHLRAGEWDAAYRKAEKVDRGVMRHLKGGTRASELLARIFVIQAVAESGRGNERLARWNWDAALEIHPPVQERSLEPYEEAGRFLTRESGCGCDGNSSNADLDPSEIVPPRYKHKPTPKYPRGRAVPAERIYLIVHSVIDTEGRPHSPNVLQGEDEPLLMYSALRTLRDWAFEPATLGGEPVSVYYNVTVHFGRY